MDSLRERDQKIYFEENKTIQFRVKNKQNRCGQWFVF